MYKGMNLGLMCTSENGIFDSHFLINRRICLKIEYKVSIFAVAIRQFYKGREYIFSIKMERELT